MELVNIRSEVSGIILFENVFIAILLYMSNLDI